MEILLVDSCSMDKTITLAKHYPISIYQLKEENISPSAGRYIGVLEAKYDYILFLDSDSLLIENWIRDAFPVLLANREVAGVFGPIFDVYSNDPEDVEATYQKIKENNDKIELIIQDNSKLHGTFLAKRKILCEIPFNPYLWSEEEADLSYRLKNQGCVLKSLNKVIALHLDAKYTKKRFFPRAKFTIGIGQNIKYSLGEEYFIRNIIRLRHAITRVGIFISFLIAVLSLLYQSLYSRNIAFLLIATVFILFPLVYLMIRYRSIYEGIRAYLFSLSSGLLILYGFCTIRKQIQSFPINHRKIQ